MFRIIRIKGEEMQQLRVWWIPQVPMESFYIDVDTVKEGVKLTNVLAQYDSFQYNNGIKPDYSNAGGLEMFDEDDGTWRDWYHESEEHGYYDDPEEFIKDTK